MNKLNFKGDVRDSEFTRVVFHPEDGRILVPSHSEYNEGTNLTTVYYEEYEEDE